MQTQALTCGHRFDVNCLKTNLSTYIRCPSCRNTPLGFDPTRIDCTRCLEYPDDERTPAAIFSVSRKCKHVHAIKIYKLSRANTRRISINSRRYKKYHELNSKRMLPVQGNLVPLITWVLLVINVPFIPDMPQFEIPGLPYPLPSQRRSDEPAKNRRREEISKKDIRSSLERK